MKLRILNVGVCGTDREIASFLYGRRPTVPITWCWATNALGEVVEAGPEVTGSQAGRSGHPDGAPALRPSGMHRLPGRAGRISAITGDYTERGIMKMHGFMTELIVDEARYMNPVPAAIRDVAVLVEPLTIAEKALHSGAGRCRSGCPGTRTMRIRRWCWARGRWACWAPWRLRNHGFEVTVYSRDREPNAAADIVKAIGGKYISSQDRTIEQMAGDVGNIDLVYEATGASQARLRCAAGAGNERLVHPDRRAGQAWPDRQFDTDTIMRNLVLKNQCVLGTVNAGKMRLSTPSPI